MPRPNWQDFASIHRTLGRDMAKAVEEALARLGNLSPEVRELIAAGRIDRAVEMLPWSDMMTNLERRVYRIALQVQAKAAATAERRYSLGYRFDVMNPEAVRSAQRQAGDLVREVTVETRQAINGIVTRAQRDGIDVREQARLIRQHVGLTRAQANAVYNFRRGLVERGLKPERIDRMVERRREQALRYRATTIARTETIRAAADGQQNLWRQGVAQGIIPPSAVRIWVASPDACPICKPMNGQRVGLEQEFRPGAVRQAGGTFGRPDGVLTPPAHPRCRCSLSLEIAA